MEVFDHIVDDLGLQRSTAALGPFYGSKLGSEIGVLAPVYVSGIVIIEVWHSYPLLQLAVVKPQRSHTLAAYKSRVILGFLRRGALGARGCRER